MIPITVNGQPREVPAGSTLADLVAQLADTPQALATALNQEFVARDARAARVLQAGDQVFTFQPITGG
ncbi:MAG: thiamine biosynthesis protein ThiS [Pseudomonadota bacterium]|jgi:sulfur carrier protein